MNIVRGVAYAALLGLLALIVAVAVAAAYLPSYGELTKRNDLGQMIRVRAANGQVLVSLGPSFGTLAALRPDPGRNARGDDLDRGPALPQPYRRRSDRRRAARSMSALDDRPPGQRGSTITQQLARNIFLTNNRTFGRKLKEAVLALALERKFSKDQILELYLNRVYFGGGAYGIDAASRKFFGHGADQLSLGEAAIIAGLVKAPSNYSPSADVEAARARRASCSSRWSRTASSRADAAASVDPAERPHPADHQPEQRPLLHRLGAAATRHADRRDQRADRRVDHARSGHAGRRRPRDPRQCPRRRAGRAGGDRSRRRGAGDGRRQGLCRIRSTTARPRRRASPDRRSSCSSISPRSNRG